MARFNPGDWRHRRDPPAGVEYIGSRTIRIRRPRSIVIRRGDHISRRQYENMRYLQAGWATKSQYENVQKLRPPPNSPHEVYAFQRWRKIYARERGIDLWKVRGPDNPYSEAFAKAYYDNFKDTSPDGPMARLLALVGLRHTEDFWDVGDTP